MRLNSNTAWRGLIILVLLAAIWATGTASGQPAAKEKKTFHLEFDQAKWRTVIEWFADKANLHVPSTDFPKGTFSFTPAKSPDGKPVEYTVPEILDILNRALERDGWILFRLHNHLLWVWPLDKKIPNVLKGKQIGREELADKGNTELVVLLVKVQHVMPTKVSREMKRIIGDIGDATPLDELGAIEIHGKAGAVKKALERLDILEMGRSAATGQPVAKDKKTFHLEFDHAKWRTVIEWFADKGELQIQTTIYPKGTFDFKPAKGADGKPVKYTVPEILDILNRALERDGYIILRNKNSLWVWSLDKKIPNFWKNKWVTREELADKGNTEFVAMLEKVSYGNPAEIALELKRIIGDQGEVIPLNKLGAFEIHGQVGAVKKALELLDLGGVRPHPGPTLTFLCKWLRADMAEAALKRRMAKSFEPMAGKGKPGAKPMQSAADTVNNAVIVIGTEQQVELAKALLTVLDIPCGRPPCYVGTFVMKQYNLSTPNALELATALQPMWNSGTTIKAIGNSAIMVYAPAEDQAMIALQCALLNPVVTFLKSLGSK